VSKKRKTQRPKVATLAERIEEVERRLAAVESRPQYVLVSPPAPLSPDPAWWRNPIT
jgi:hypothetical protein